VPDAAALSAAQVATLATVRQQSACYLQTGNCLLQGKIDIDTSVPSVTARTTRPLSTTAVKPRTEAGRSSNSNSSCQPCFLCRCTDRLELTAEQCRQLEHFGNF